MFFIWMVVFSAVFAAGQAQPYWEDLSKQASALQRADNFAGAESLRREALLSAEEKLGPEDPKLVPLYSDLAVTLHFEGRDAEADGPARQAVALASQSGNKRLMGVSLSILGVVLCGEKQSVRAEPILRRSVALLEEAEGTDSFEAAKAENNFAMVYLDMHEYAKAEHEMVRALPVYERMGADSEEVALISGNMFTILAAQHRADEGEPYLRRALAIGEKAFPNSLKMANLEVCLAALENSHENYKEAARLLESAIATQEKVLGPEHRSLARMLEAYAAVLRHLHQKSEAKVVQNRANLIMKSALSDVK